MNPLIQQTLSHIKGFTYLLSISCPDSLVANTLTAGLGFPDSVYFSVVNLFTVAVGGVASQYTI